MHKSNLGSRMVVFALGLVLAGFGEHGRAAEPSSGAILNIYERGREVAARVEAGLADPQADAAVAIARDEFGLFVFAFGRDDVMGRAIGLTCFTPWMKAPRVLASFGGGDAIDERTRKLLVYGAAYNRVIVEDVGFPDADICVPETPRDPRLAQYDLLPTQAARTLVRAPLSLHEAARRGDLADLSRFSKSDVNRLDGAGMTPLAWAVARDNAAAVAYLVEAGANPWLSDNWPSGGAVYWSALAGRVDYFTRLARLPGKPFLQWPALYLRAAAQGGGPVLDSMLSQPHDLLSLAMLNIPLPPVAVVEKFLREGPSQADALLARATQAGIRSDLVALALRYKANPDVEAYASRTVLGETASGIDPASVETVDVLLKAGANPNGLSWIHPPLLIALRTQSIFRSNPTLIQRSLAIYRRLRQAGADINLPDGEGVPMLRGLLFPSRYNHDELDAGAVTPSVLEMLARDGLDLNATWRGHRVLELVEEQAGPNSELAVTLRRLGARR